MDKHLSYGVRNDKDPYIGIAVLILLLGFVIVVPFPDDGEAGLWFFAMIGFTALAVFFIASYCCVKDVQLSEDAITFLPVGVCVSLETVIDIKMEHPSVFDHYGDVQGVTLLFSSDAFHWVPLNILRMGRFGRMRLFGMPENVAFYDELSKIVEERRAT